MSSNPERFNQVLLGIASGQPRKAIAADLGISEKTVDYHVKNIERKTKRHSVAMMKRYAIKIGLIAPKDL